jgi:hypothetical protein
MYSVSDKFNEQIKADNREFSVALTFNSSTELTGATIQSISVDEVVNSTDTLTFGCACSNKITINLINAPGNIDYENSYFTARVGLKVGEFPTVYEYVPLGKFYVTEAKTSNDFKNLAITAYDGFCKMTDIYNATVSADTTLQAVYDDLRTQLSGGYGITLVTRTLPEYTLTFPYLANITFQQAIGYVAGCLGGFARFNRDGELEISTYEDTEYVIDRSTQYMGGFKRLTKKDLFISSISTGTKEKPIFRGDGANGTEISFENPYITDAMADDIYARNKDLTYTPCQVKWRGNPAIQAGDIVQALDSDGIAHNVLVMSQKLKVSNGLNSDIECKGKATTKAQFSNNFKTTAQKIENIYTTLEQQILDATNAITGNSGGYVRIIDTNGDTHPDEIVITDHPEISLAQNVWRWNKGGLGHSSNGYAGPYSTAITADGRINADLITTGTLNAERIAVESFDNETGLLTDYIHFDKGTMVFGKGENALTLKLENNNVAFYSGDTRIAYFSNNSFEIENLTDGKIRFQSFGFIPRASGNLTFTKLV